MVTVALLIGSIEPLQVLSAKLSLEGGFWGLLNNLDFQPHRIRHRDRVRHLGHLDRRVEEGGIEERWSTMVGDT